MVLRLFVLMVALFSLPLLSDFRYRKWHEELRWREGMTKENCPRNPPHAELKGPHNSLNGGACKRARAKALETKCIPKDIFDAMELCNLVPRCYRTDRHIYGCYSDPCSDVELWSWDTCDKSLIHSMSTIFSGCEPCYDCDFVRNCWVDADVPYFKNFQFEMEFTVRYHFECKTESGIPLNNIGLTTENGFKLFEQTLDGTMTLTGKDYLRLTDLNPSFTRQSSLDVNCQLDFYEPVKTRLSAHSRELLEKNWSEIQTLSDAVSLLRSAHNQIQIALEEKGKKRFTSTNVLKDILVILEDISSSLPADDGFRDFLNPSIQRIQKHLSKFKPVQPDEESDFYSIAADLGEELNKPIPTVTEKMGQIYYQSIRMMGYDSDLSDQYEAGFHRIYQSFKKSENGK